MPKTFSIHLTRTEVFDICDALNERARMHRENAVRFPPSAAVNAQAASDLNALVQRLIDALDQRKAA